MKIHGIGNDLINVNRIEKVIKKNKNFLKKIFTKNEIRYCNNKMNKYYCFAKRFSAKESFSKALGTGISRGLKFNEIEIINNNKGKPNIKILGKSKQIVQKILHTKKLEIFVSISDDKPYASSVVLLATK